ncbi:hypothetical protein RIF29_04407 [Crotalaria pallida]|uniref:Uncharacterized protein n=1 Tax=Crotalaria pallida TaxID=3830 RepID=A0AAN9PA11_CROPI
MSQPELEVMNSKNEHQKIAKKWVEVKEQDELPQIKNFAEEIQKTKKQVSTVEIAAMKIKLEHKKVVGLAGDQKTQIEELNAKIIQLQDQKQKLELENQQLKEKLDSKSNMEEEFRKMVSDLMKKERSRQELAESYKTQTIKESEINDKLKKDPKQKSKKKEDYGLGLCIVLDSVRS